jgi:tripartite-type tricarboxylate transporter receptor subunit TctC
MANLRVHVSAVPTCICSIFLASWLLFAVGEAAAQVDHPTHPVRLVIGFGAGTSPDVVARVLADKLSQKWGKPVIIENVTGASGNIAGERVARAAPDGHTLLLAASSGLVMNPSLYGKMPFDPVKDLAPISIVFSYSNVLVVHKDVTAHSVQELVALARAHPGVLKFASPGAGTTIHLAGEMLKSMAGIDIQHVPYRGGVNLITDLVAGRIHVYFGPTTTTLEQARAGTVRALAVTGSKRNSVVANLPTMIESGFPNFDVTAWWGVMAPAKTRPEIIDALHRDTVEALASPDIRKRFHDMSVEPSGSSPTDFAAQIRAELPRWEKVIREAGVRLD